MKQQILNEKNDVMKKLQNTIEIAQLKIPSNFKITKACFDPINAENYK